MQHDDTSEPGSYRPVDAAGDENQPEPGTDESSRDPMERDPTKNDAAVPDDGGDGSGGLPPAPEGALDLAYAMDPEQMESLDRRVVAYWLLGGILGVAILTAIGTTAWILFGEHLPGNHLVWTIVFTTLLALMVAWNLVAPLLAWQRWRFDVREDLMLARYGIVFHEEKAIPISRLQHVELGRGPLERLFGLATLVVFTAGSENAAFRLPGLRVERACELRDQILEARGEDVL